ncbi:MAG: hypothetical protein HZB65_02190 [Candidatus Aenigmarchaeota archaeon]|nr:hypothetical protein [Candidatus Aenigmarchaeota archaeon]
MNEKTFMREAVENAKKENWNYIDTSLMPRIMNYDQGAIYADLKKMFHDKNYNVRDLAGTIAAKIRYNDLTKDQQKDLKKKLETRLNDSYTFARFRAAIALVEHGIFDAKHIISIQNTLTEQEIRDDPELNKLAWFAIQN